MFYPSLSDALVAARKRRTLTQVEAADLCGVARPRLADIEAGRRRPTELELARLVDGLDMPRESLPKAAPAGSLAALRRRPLTANWRAPSDRDPHVRFLAALREFPEVAAALTRQIKQRPDFLQISHVTERLALGSCWEALVVLYLLSRGAVPALRIPALLGWLPHPCVNPANRELVGHLAHYCLELDGRYFFCQVSLATPQIFTVDFLCWDPVNGWTVWEVDGPGHDPSRDGERTRALKLPVRRLSADMVRTGSF